MERFGLYATPSVSALFFLSATVFVFTDDPAGTAAQAGLSLAFFYLLFGGLDFLTAVAWIAVARFASAGKTARARIVATTALVWLIIDAFLSVAWWPTYEGNDWILASLLGVGLLQVLYIATVLNPAPGSAVGDSRS